MLLRLAALVASAALIGSAQVAPVFARSDDGQSASKDLRKINHIVVIYQENHSFDNLLGNWGGVNGRSAATPAHTLQVNQAGTPFTCLSQTDVNLSSLPCSTFPNAPFAIDSFIPSTAATCPAPGVFAPNGVLNGSPGALPGGCTRDIVHRFYQEQYQLNNGRMNRYTTGSDAVGLTQGYYDSTKLPIYAYLHSEDHPSYAIADDFFQAAFGGSFLNHQWLVAAATPVWTGASNDGTAANDLHSVADVNGMPNNYPLYVSPAGSTVKDNALTASCTPGPGRGITPHGVLCGDYAVNTIQPFNQPYSPGTAAAKRLPPLTTPTIGDSLSAANVDWAWYSGGWSDANGSINGPGWTGTATACGPGANPKAVFPNCPDNLFQFHHQALNYYAAYAPGTPARAAHLRDEVEFQSLAAASGDRCNLKPVSFVKPIGADNEHPGYTGETSGNNHLVSLLKSIENSSCAKNTMVIVTYDEFGGQWDHVTPPGQGGVAGAHDVFGPGTRIPALVLAPHLQGSFVTDHAAHDTTSILATIEHRFGLPALGTRDAAVKDLATVFKAGESGGDNQQD